MGNSSSSLSRAHCRYSRRAYHHGEGARVSSKQRADELCQPPQLKPCIVYNNNDQHTTQLHIAQGSAASVSKTPGDRLKVIKKVRFSDELLLISSSTAENDPSLISTHVNEGKISEEVLHGKKNPSRIFIHPSTRVLMYPSCSVELLNESSSLGRVKVVISKKELSDLILKTREKQGSEVDSVERTPLPFLFHQSSFTKFSTTHSHNIQQDPLIGTVQFCT